MAIAGDFDCTDLSSAAVLSGRSRSIKVHAGPRTLETIVIQKRSPIARARALFAAAITLGMSACCWALEHVLEQGAAIAKVLESARDLDQLVNDRLRQVLQSHY